MVMCEVSYCNGAKVTLMITSPSAGITPEGEKTAESTGCVSC